MKETVLALAAVLASAAACRAQTYWAHGYHGGYYLTNERDCATSLDKVFAALEAAPNYKVVLELEPYTLEAMQHGERFACERHGRDQAKIAGWPGGGVGPQWSTSITHYPARGGSAAFLDLNQGQYAHYVQPLDATSLRGHKLRFSGSVKVLSGTGAHLYLDAWDSAGYIPGSSHASSLAAAGAGWQSLAVDFTVPAQAVTIFPQVKVGPQPCQADFDDLSLVDVTTGRQLLDNPGFDEVTEPQLRDERRLARLRELIESGRAEVVGGAYTQPILYAIGQESAVRQFLYGCQAVEQSLGAEVTIYAAQEPDMIGQLPQLLSQLGFQGALYRTHWAIFGSPPHRDAEAVWWRGPDGSRIRAVPAYELTPLRNYGLPGTPSRSLVEAARARGTHRPLFSVFGDLVPHWVPEPGADLYSGSRAEGWANLCKMLPADGLQGKQVVLSASVRARRPGAHLYIDAHNQQGVAISGAQSDDAAADGQWHSLRVRFAVPDAAVRLFPQARIIAGQGDADFDSVSLKVLPEGRQLLPDGGFEADSLPEGWAVGASQDAEASHQVASQEPAAGERYVRLRMQAPAIDFEFTTLAEYFDRVGQPQQEWTDAYAGFQHRFPWGLMAGAPQLTDRQGEDALLRTERLFAIARRDPGDGLDDAWRLLMMGQHHDGWVCAPVLFGFWQGYKCYAEVCAAASLEAQELCRGLTEKLRTPSASQRFVVLNAAGHARRQVIPVELPLPPGALKEPAAEDHAGRPAAAQLQVSERHADGSAKQVKGWLLADVPGLGYAAYRLREGSAPPLPTVRVESEAGLVRLSNRQVSARVSREGLLEAFDRSGRRLLSQPIRLAGNLPGVGEQRSIVERVSGRKAGPMGEAVAEGKIGSVPFTGVVRLAPVSPLIRLRLELDFGEKTEMGAEEGLPDVPQFARDEDKLRLVVPLPFSPAQFYAQEAFHIRPVQQTRHPVLRYALAQGGGRGVAVFSDRATAGVFRQRPSSLALVLGYGGGFLYAPDKYAPLKGRHSFELALAFYEGNLATAQIPLLAEELSQPLLVWPAPEGREAFGADRRSTVSIEPSNAAVLTAAYPQGRDLVLRLWRPYPGQSEATLTVVGTRALFSADLRGRAGRRLAAGPTAKLPLKQNQVLTLRAAR